MTYALNNTASKGLREQSGKKPTIRVVQIHNPVYVQTDVLSFPSLVQKLTGMQSSTSSTRSDSYTSGADSASASLMRSPSLELCNLAGAAQPEDGAAEDRRACELVEDLIGSLNSACGAAADGSLGHCCCSSSFHNSMYPSFHHHQAHHHHHHHQEYCRSLQNKLDLGIIGADHHDRLKSLKMQQRHGFSDLDIWAGLLSDQTLPDISTLPPLLF
ncbi:hypothetical protein GOP47_0014195 [Adiantum capillus-veneris]|uniref:VQ domain-containing protein n=1 Tax=Adiantum capillus-veneris TaxID=13818 RepID=A0A9D4UPZ4_ADICA|nr:hypothetical protein GOP47_0014195 [Adiantum capillus-veneris]